LGHSHTVLELICFDTISRMTGRTSGP